MRDAGGGVWRRGMQECGEGGGEEKNACGGA